jgi:hypothetical protein
VQPWTRSTPSVGKRSAFGPATRIGAVCPGMDLERSLNAGAVLRRDLKCGKPAFLPLRTRDRELEKFASACAAFTDAHSNTSAEISLRQTNPRLPSGFAGVSNVLPVFQAFISLMNDTFDQDSGGVSWSAGTS